MNNGIFGGSAKNEPEGDFYSLGYSKFNVRKIIENNGLSKEDVSE